MEIIVIKTQAELDALPDSFNEAIYIEIRSSELVSVRKNYINGRVQACDSSRVQVCGSSQVEAYDSSQVRACDSSQVEAYDSSQVQAYDSSQVEAYASSQVETYGSSQVRAYGSSQVEAYGSSQVRTYDSSQVEAYDSSQVQAYDSSQVRAYDSSQVRTYDSSQVEAYLLATIIIYSSAALVKKLLDNTHLIYKKEGVRPLRVDSTAKITEFKDIITPTFDQWLERGEVVADDIRQKLVSSKTFGQVTVYETTDLFRGKNDFVARNGEKFAHGETIEEAIADLRYKISDRDTSAYERWTLETLATQDEMIEAYRKTTGACSEGVKMFMKEIGQIPKSLSVSNVIELTNGRYGSEIFADFFAKK